MQIQVYYSIENQSDRLHINEQDKTIPETIQAYAVAQILLEEYPYRAEQPLQNIYQEYLGKHDSVKAEEIKQKLEDIKKHNSI